MPGPAVQTPKLWSPVWCPILACLPRTAPAAMPVDNQAIPSLPSPPLPLSLPSTLSSSHPFSKGWGGTGCQHWHWVEDDSARLSVLEETTHSGWMWQRELEGEWGHPSCIPTTLEEPGGSRGLGPSVWSKRGAAV